MPLVVDEVDTSISTGKSDVGMPTETGLGVNTGSSPPKGAMLAALGSEVATLRKYRRHAYIVIFIIAAVITPTPDPINQSLFALPLIVLYEVAIFVAASLKRRRKDEIIEV